MSGTLPDQYSKTVIFYKTVLARQEDAVTYTRVPYGQTRAVWSPEHGVTMLSLETFHFTFDCPSGVETPQVPCFIKCLFSRNPMLLKQVLSMMK